MESLIKAHHMRRAPQLLERLTRRSKLLDYFSAFHAMLTTREGASGAKKVYYVHSSNPSAAMVLSGFFNRQIGLLSCSDTVERTLPEHGLRYGVEIELKDVDDNYEALDYITLHFNAHSEIMDMLHRNPRIIHAYLKQNHLILSARADMCRELATLGGATYHRLHDTAPVVAAFDSISISVVSLHHNSESLRAILEPNGVILPTRRYGKPTLI